MKSLISLLAVLTLSGCVSIQPVIERTVIYDAPVPTESPVIDPVIQMSVCVPMALETVSKTPINKDVFIAIPDKAQGIVSYVEALEEKNRELESIISDYYELRLNCYDL